MGLVNTHLSKREAFIEDGNFLEQAIIDRLLLQVRCLQLMELAIGVRNLRSNARLFCIGVNNAGKTLLKLLDPLLCSLGSANCLTPSPCG
jgi:hypothetical protein